MGLAHPEENAGFPKGHSRDLPRLNSHLNLEPSRIPARVGRDEQTVGRDEQTVGRDERAVGRDERAMHSSDDHEFDNLLRTHSICTHSIWIQGRFNTLRYPGRTHSGSSGLTNRRISGLFLLDLISGPSSSGPSSSGPSSSGPSSSGLTGITARCRQLQDSRPYL